MDMQSRFAILIASVRRIKYDFIRNLQLYGKSLFEILIVNGRLIDVYNVYI